MKPPAYRENLSTGIVHFGPGAFHRAHQADYIHRLLGTDPRWGIAAVSLRSRGTIDALRRQNGLYTLAILDSDRSFRTIGTHTHFYGPGETDAVRDRLRQRSVRIVSSTVTEKGYCLAGDGTLDFAHPDIVHDLDSPQEPVSIVGWLALGLADRRRDRQRPFVTLCCDNMRSNGQKLRGAVVAFAQQLDPELARWIDGEAQFPDTMVDSITPATDDRLRRLVREQTGAHDQVPVCREGYTQWVIEDALPDDMPHLASIGVDITSDVPAWEQAKLRILNGAHSSLAYIGLLIGHELVADAMFDPALSEFVQKLVIEDIVPTVEPSPLNLATYVQETLQRFRNPAINHQLSQIAWDGSQKLPYRLLDTIADARSAGRPIGRLVIPVAAWIHFLERQNRAGANIIDPLANVLKSAIGSPDPVAAILDIEQIFPRQLSRDARFREAVSTALERMRSDGVLKVISSEPALA